MTKDKENKKYKELTDQDLNNSIIDSEEKEGITHETKELMETWLNDDFIHAKTSLNPNQIIALTILKTLSEKYDITCIKELILNFVRYKLSEGRQSSKELVEILKSRQEIPEDDSLAKQIDAFIK